MMSFSKLAKRLAGKEVAVFLDLEGTQFSHAPISIGAILFTLGDDLKLVQACGTYHAYIQVKDHVGNIVSGLTGITNKMLCAEGKEKDKVLKDLINLCRPYSRKAFIAYGEQDIKMLWKLMNQESYSRDYLTHITKNYFDFHQYIASLFSENNSFSPSLIKLAEIFHIPVVKRHDSYQDAVVLSEIYQKFVDNEEKTIQILLDAYPDLLNEEKLRTSL